VSEKTAIQFQTGPTGTILKSLTELSNIKSSFADAVGCNGRRCLNGLFRPSLRRHRLNRSSSMTGSSSRLANAMESTGSPSELSSPLLLAGEKGGWMAADI
jgi:hypothetical protein